ncbi:alpha/beta fold hydrolase [Buchnera aphidicola]|uniref:Pimeloyl-[acyl-carrier protein] methyl ester esterase n=1 Tax=Buchnera aphidicola (Cinara strobi) TaxID=1921549 RepID=A0A3B1E1C5_9GAMM|nr:alpha/beta fold hydrolase [Buchnera aphidicola]VAX76855.1 Pimeloyl-[acyl-carrier protein] methyl ester esterase [Buchnera aphidicola (Cinara strobi)]
MKKTKKKIYWSTIGKGEIHIILLHGWGLSCEIWRKIVPLLKEHFTLHLIDLPGFGKSINCPIMNFKKLSLFLLKNIKYKVIWLGWSIGGLFAHYLSFKYPEHTIAVIYITSSPCFIKKKNWPGVTIKILKEIKKNMLSNYKKFIIEFIKLHAIIDKKKKHFYSQKNYSIAKKYPNPNKKAIEIGYKWLIQIDQRKKKLKKNIPTLRIYGEFDNLVSFDTCKAIEKLWKKNNFFIIPGARHAPFLSHPDVLCYMIKKFIKKIFPNS